MEAAHTIRVLLGQEGSWWLAQCLEFDIVVQARTMQNAIDDLTHVLNARVRICEKEGVDPFKLSKAPKEYWDLYEKALELKQREEDSTVHHINLPHLQSVVPDLRITA